MEIVLWFAIAIHLIWTLEKIYYLYKILNSKSCIYPKGVDISYSPREELWFPNNSCVIKQLSSNNLKEHYLQVKEFANKDHQTVWFDPLELWTVLYKRIWHHFLQILQLIECLCGSYSNANIRSFFDLHENY